MSRQCPRKKTLIEKKKFWDMKKETTIGIPCFYWLWSDQQVQREVQSNLLEELDKSDDVLAAFAYLEVRGT